MLYVAPSFVDFGAFFYFTSNSKGAFSFLKGATRRSIPSDTVMLTFFRSTSSDDKGIEYSRVQVLQTHGFSFASNSASVITICSSAHRAETLSLVYPGTGR